MSDVPAREFIKLDQFLKLAQIVETGGQAKHLIQSGAVRSMAMSSTRRGRKLYHGDTVQIDDEFIQVVMEE